METQYRCLLDKWPNHAGLVSHHRPVLVLATQGLADPLIESLQSDFIATSGDLISVITSLKMMHIYFRLKSETFDYRPHRGRFSGLTRQPYRVAKSDRSEVLLRLESSELERFRNYAANIEEAPAKILGKTWAWQITEPDFTVRSHATLGNLNDNRMVDPKDRHNCLTWFSTAPLGDQGYSVIKLLEMAESDIHNEAHSYIVAFYRYLVAAAPQARVPGMVYWTKSSLAVAKRKILDEPNFLNDFYSVSATSPLDLANGSR